MGGGSASPIHVRPLCYLLNVDSLDAERIELHKDYVRVCEAGLRRRPTDPVLLSSVERLVEAQLAFYEGDYLTLQRPAYGAEAFPPEELSLLENSYVEWLHAEQLSTGEQVLYGHSGFWQHWWNLLHEQTEHPLCMDVVLPDVPEVHRRNWTLDVRADLLRGVTEAGALRLRVLIPPGEPEGGLAELAALIERSGFEVRVRSSPFLFAVYRGTAAVISERENQHDEAYFLTRRPSIVAPLQQVFDDHWRSAIPWTSYTRGASDMLELMSLGWTDLRIAESLGLSMRTVSRRIADAMAAAGVSSRFELGVRYAQSRG